MIGNDFDLHANVKVDIQFFNSPHLTDGGREKHLWMLGVWSISSVSRLWRLYRLFHQRAPVPIEFTAIVCQALHLWFSPQACFAFYLFWRFSSRGSKSSTLGKSARVWSVRSVSGCARVIQLRSDVVEKRDWGRFNKGHFCSKVSDRLTLCLQSDTRWQKMKVSNVGHPRFTGLNIISHLRFEQK